MFLLFSCHFVSRFSVHAILFYYKFIVMKKVSAHAWYRAKSDGYFHLHDATVLISVALITFCSNVSQF